MTGFTSTQQSHTSEVGYFIALTRKRHLGSIIPWRYLSENPKVANHPDNLAALCVSCHGIKTVAIERPLAKGDFAPLHKFYGDRAERAIALAKEYGLKL
jgi:hypothetical protein